MWYLNLKEEHQSKVLWKIFGSEKDEVSRQLGYCIMRNSMIYTHHPAFLGQ
jgi:hypothetical protein